MQDHLIRVGVIVVVNLIMYYKTLFYGYVGDDVERSERKEPVFKNRWHSYWIQFIGLRHINSMHSHLISILTHTACCVTIYFALGRNPVSWLTALLFSINPVNIQGSVWISGRNYVTSSILAFAMFIFPPLSWATYMATSHFAVNAWFAPLAFLGTPYWYYVGIIPLVWLCTSNNRNTLNRKLWETGGLKTTNKEMRSIKPAKFIPFVKTYLYYFTLCLIPFNLGIEHNYLRGFGTNKTDNDKGYKLDWQFFVGATLFLSVVAWSVYCIFHGWHPIAWGIFWFTINIAMWCNFITMQQHIAERYIYLAGIGMMYALANLIISYPVVISAILVGYSVRLWYIMDTYLNDHWAVEYTLAEIKNMYYMWLMRGVKKFVNKDYLGAAYDFNEAYRNKPYDLKVLYDLSSTYFILGDIVQARTYFEKAKANIYDELENEVKPAFEQLEGLIKIVEAAKDRGETNVQIDLSKLIVVK